MKNSINSKGIILVSALILFAAFTRLIPHPFGFTAVGAMALFGSAVFNKKVLAFFVPIFTMWFSDIIINNFINGTESFALFYSYQIYTLLPMALIVLFGMFFFNKITPAKILGGSLASALIFFIVSNFGAWTSVYALFPKTFMGLMETYVAGLPFLRNDLAGTIFFSTLLFGAHYLLTLKFPSFKLAKEKIK